VAWMQRSEIRVIPPSKRGNDRSGDPDCTLAPSQATAFVIPRLAMTPWDGATLTGRLMIRKDVRRCNHLSVCLMAWWPTMRPSG
jgi:hypothetical protein